MTSKEFKDGIQYWSVLDSAVQFFFKNKDSIVFKVDICFYDLVKRTFYCSFELLPVVRTMKSCYIDRFTFDDFIREIKFFKSFVNKCSVYQKMQLSHESSLFNLLKYIGYNVG